MSASRAVARGRAAAEAHMTSRCTIRRKTGNMVLDGDNQEVPEWVTTYTDLPCRVAASAGESRARIQRPGDVEIERATPRVDVPAATSNLADGDHIEVTSGENTGVVFRLIESGWVDQSTARRLPVEAVERPQEWGA